MVLFDGLGGIEMEKIFHLCACVRVRRYLDVVHPYLFNLSHIHIQIHIRIHVDMCLGYAVTALTCTTVISKTLATH
jgi:hypothetical protein